MAKYIMPEDEIREIWAPLFERFVNEPYDFNKTFDENNEKLKSIGIDVDSSLELITGTIDTSMPLDWIANADKFPWFKSRSLCDKKELKKFKRVCKKWGEWQDKIGEKIRAKKT